MPLRGRRGAARLEHTLHGARRVGCFRERLAVRHLQRQAVPLCKAGRQLGHGAAQSIQLALQLGTDGEQQAALAGRHAEGTRAHIYLDDGGQHYAPVPCGLGEAGSAHTSSLTAAAGFLPSSGVLACVGAPRKVQLLIPVEAQCMVPSQQEHRALCQPRHIVKGVHFFDGLFFQKCGAHGAAFAPSLPHAGK